MAEALDRQVAARRGIEALRSGVPSRGAVAALGTAQPEIEDRFSILMDQIRRVPEGNSPPRGVLIGGDFGSGKSHVLEHLTCLALNAGFVVSKVVISKETPLYDPVKVFRAAIDSAMVAGEMGSALPQIASRLQVDSPSYSEFFRWVHSPASGLNERFAASLYLYERLRAADEEFAQSIVRFWGGEPIRVPDLRRRLKETSNSATYPLPPVNQRNLALQRFGFVAGLTRPAGYSGWIVLFDEVELIGRYSVLQRAKSYAEIARWIQAGSGTPFGTVLAMTSDFEAAVLSARNDQEMVPDKLRSRQTPESDAMADQAEQGMRIIEREMVRLSPPDDAELDRTYLQLKRIHAEAYGWDPPQVAGLERLRATRIRQHVRAWINEWDLVRLDAAFVPETEAVEIAVNYSEVAELEGPAEDG
ncbi:DUF2791 family P-loop domain-containing protein [soil metagenome]